MAPRPLLERSREREALLALAAEVRTGTSRLAVITGEAGVGKSRLCQEVLDALPVAWHRCVRHRSEPSHVPSGPAVVVVEDVHDPDPDSARRIRALLARDPATLVLCTHRLGPDTRMAAPRTADAVPLLRIPGAVELRLDPLSPAATATLVRQLGAEIGDDATERLHERTGGNPLFIEELVKVGEAFADRLGDDRTRTLHLDLAAALADLPEPHAHRIADQLLTADDACAADRALARARDAAARHRHVRAARLLQLVVEDRDRPAGVSGVDDDSVRRLTPRERSVVSLVAEGLTNKEIGARLHLSDKTVRNQLSLLFAKLGIRRRSQAAAFAVRHGLATGGDRGD